MTNSKLLAKLGLTFTLTVGFLGACNVDEKIENEVEEEELEDAIEEDMVEPTGELEEEIEEEGLEDAVENEELDINDKDDK